MKYIIPTRRLLRRPQNKTAMNNLSRSVKRIYRLSRATLNISEKIKSNPGWMNFHRALLRRHIDDGKFENLISQKDGLIKFDLYIEFRLGAFN